MDTANCFPGWRSESPVSWQRENPVPGQPPLLLTSSKISQARLVTVRGLVRAAVQLESEHRHNGPLHGRDNSNCVEIQLSERSVVRNARAGSILPQQIVRIPNPWKYIPVDNGADTPQLEQADHRTREGAERDAGEGAEVTVIDHIPAGWRWSDSNIVHITVIISAARSKEKTKLVKKKVWPALWLRLGLLFELDALRPSPIIWSEKGKMRS